MQIIEFEINWAIVIPALLIAGALVISLIRRNKNRKK
jgi:hypothetical protein